MKATIVFVSGRVGLVNRLSAWVALHSLPCHAFCIHMLMLVSCELSTDCLFLVAQSDSVGRVTAVLHRKALVLLVTAIKNCFCE